MSNPLTLAAAAMTAASTIGQANSRASQAEDAAVLNEQRAKTHRKISARNATDLRRRNASILASRKVRYGRGGIVLSGTPLDLLADAAAEGELAVQDEQYRGDALASDRLRQADKSRRSANTIRRQGTMLAGSQLLRLL